MYDLLLFIYFGCLVEFVEFGIWVKLGIRT